MCESEKPVTACHCSPALLIDTKRSDDKNCVESSPLGVHELSLEPAYEWELETFVRAGYNGKFKSTWEIKKKDLFIWKTCNIFPVAFSSCDGARS